MPRYANHVRNRSLALAALAVLGLSFCWGAGPEDPPARELIDGIQDFENTLGFSKTHNFDRDSSAIKAYYRCYYTGPLELPRSYERPEVGVRNIQREWLVVPGDRPGTYMVIEVDHVRTKAVGVHQDF